MLIGSLAGLLIALVAAEGILRLRGGIPDERLGLTLPTSPGNFEERYHFDPELGYVPIFSEGWYGPHGAKPNPYSIGRRPEGVTRVVFLGDSVAARGMLQISLRERLAARGADGDFEFWTFAVEGYATRQELGYYRRYGRAAEPDRVVLLFHLNDFVQTPVLYQLRDGRVEVLTLSGRLRVRPWLVQASQIYRWWVARRMGKVSEHDDEDAARAEVRASLRDFRDLLAADGVPFDVLVLPFFGDPGILPLNLRAILEQRRAAASEILAELGIWHLDLTPPIERAVADGITVDEVPLDWYHPNLEAGRAMAEFLEQEGFLERLATR